MRRRQERDSLLDDRGAIVGVGVEEHGIGG